MKTVSLFAFLIISFNSLAQVVERFVISSSGSHQIGTGLSHTYTIGELAVATGTSASLIITQGFNQPEDAVFGIGEIVEFGFALNFYPNPTESILNLEITAINSMKMNLQLFDANGKAISLPIENLDIQGFKSHEIDMSQLPNGSYLLSIRDTKTNQSKTLKIQKVL